MMRNEDEVRTRELDDQRRMMETYTSGIPHAVFALSYNNSSELAQCQQLGITVCGGVKLHSVSLV